MKSFSAQKILQWSTGILSSVVIIALFLLFFPIKFSLDTVQANNFISEFSEKISLPYTRENKKISWEAYSGKNFWYYEI